MIQIKISEDAIRDLNDGFVFYEAQSRGLGDYLASCLRADLEGRRVYGGIHRKVDPDYHRLLSKVSHMVFSTRWQKIVLSCGLLLTCDVTRSGSDGS